MVHVCTPISDNVDKDLWRLDSCDSPTVFGCVPARFQFDSQFAAWLTVFDAVAAHRFGIPEAAGHRRPLERFALNLDAPDTVDFATATAASLAHTGHWALASAVADNRDMLTDCIRELMSPADLADHLTGHGKGHQANVSAPNVSLLYSTIRTTDALRKAEFAASPDGYSGRAGAALHHYQDLLGQHGPDAEWPDSTPVRLAVVETTLRTLGVDDPSSFIAGNVDEVVCALNTGVFAEYVAIYYHLSKGVK
jgi:hypothetical protein